MGKVINVKKLVKKSYLSTFFVHNNFHNFSCTEQGQKIVLYSKNTPA